MAKPKFTFGISGMVNSVYQSVFGKKVPDNFLNDREAYIKQLEKGEISPEAFVTNIMCSDFISEKNLTNEDFLNLMYKIMEVKKPDETEYEFWLSRFATRSRKGVVNGLFLTSNWLEFCSKYEIK